MHASTYTGFFERWGNKGPVCTHNLFIELENRFDIVTIREIELRKDAGCSMRISRDMIYSPPHRTASHLMQSMCSHELRNCYTCAPLRERWLKWRDRERGEVLGTYNDSVAVFVKGTDEAALQSPHLCVAPLTEVMEEEYMDRLSEKVRGIKNQRVWDSKRKRGVDE